MKFDYGNSYIAACGQHGMPCVPSSEDYRITCTRCAAFLVRKKIRIAKALQVASLCKEEGLALLYSTRKIHSEEHREKLLKEIDNRLAGTKFLVGFPEDYDKFNSIKSLVITTRVGDEWLSIEEYSNIL